MSSLSFISYCSAAALMNQPALQCKRQFIRSSHLSEFHIFTGPNVVPCTVQ